MLRTLILLLSAGLALAQQPKGTSEWQEFQNDIRKVGQARLQALQAEIAAAQAQFEELRAKYAENHPEVAKLRQRLADLRIQLERAEQVLASVGPPAPSPKIPLPDRWWRNPATAQYVGLTADQQKKMDEVFQQYRLKLIDLNAALEREEATLEPLVAAEPLDEAKITAQIDRVAQARAELEKSNGRMLLGIRKLLTPEQWTKLNQGFSLTPAQK